LIEVEAWEQLDFTKGNFSIEDPLAATTVTVSAVFVRFFFEEKFSNQKG